MTDETTVPAAEEVTEEAASTEEASEAVTEPEA